MIGEEEHSEANEYPEHDDYLHPYVYIEKRIEGETPFIERCMFGDYDHFEYYEHELLSNYPNGAASIKHITEQKYHDQTNLNRWPFTHFHQDGGFYYESYLMAPDEGNSLYEHYQFLFRLMLFDDQKPIQTEY